MNPVSHDLKKKDYENLRDLIQATGNEVHYYIGETTIEDDWGVSVRYDELDSVKVYSHYIDCHGIHTIYINGEKKK